MAPVVLASTAIAVALVTVHAVVDVTADALMLRIRIGLGVAVRALKDAVVSGIGMTSGANAICVAVIGIEPGMVESCPRPTGRGMAECACRWESRTNMVRIVCLLILHFVTAITIRGKGRVIVVHVTTRTRNLGMKACQREGCIVVIEDGRRPS